MARTRLALTVVGVALALSACSSSPKSETPTTTPAPSSSPKVAPPRIQLTDTSLQPSGWVPIEYGHAQISVPATWKVIGPPACLGSLHDAVILGGGAGDGYCPPERVQRETHVVEIEPYPYRRRGTIAISQPSVPVKVMHLSGFTVLRSVFGNTYAMPALGVSLVFFAQTDRRVLDTLTRSPRAVALGRSGAPAIPASWRRITFAGLSFAVPSTWAVSRTSVTTLGSPPCSALSDMVATTPSVVLSTDGEPAYVYHCPSFVPGRERPLRPQLGLVVDGNSKWTPTFVARAEDCRSQAGLHLCVDTSANEGILEVSAARSPSCGTDCSPVVSHPPIIALGLSGSGLTDRTILDSFRAG
ncbi:MAG: hypothetical protein ACLQK4_11185 [Acidimicrobiales bacterium]|jgi:hypothetical protein